MAVMSLTTSRSRAGDKGFRLLALGSGLLVLVLLLLITISMTRQAWPALSIDFFTSKRWAPNEEKFGGLAFIYGTFVVSLIAVVLSVPVSIALALFLTEVAPRRLRNPVVYVLDLLAAVPSVVWGLWGVLFLLSPMNTFFDWLSGPLGWTRLFEGPAAGKSFLLAGIILALMITPIVTSISREVFVTVPAVQREGAYAMGATRWEMIRGAILPYGKVGLIGAVMLGLGRAMGETIAVALVIGSSPQITARLLASGDALPAVIANQFGEASGTFRAALIGFGVLLFLITVVVNMAARAIAGRATGLSGDL